MSVKTVDDFPDLVPFRRVDLRQDEQEIYEGDWLLNMPSGRTLEFDNEVDACRVAANPPTEV